MRRAPKSPLKPPPSADLQLSIVDAPDPVEAGNYITYTLTAHNDGPDAAAGVSVPTLCRQA